MYGVIKSANTLIKGFNAVRAVEGATNVLVKSSTKIQAVANKGVFGSMFDGLGKVLGFGGRVIAESSGAATTLLRANPTKTLAMDQVAALAAIGVGIGITAKAGSDILKHSRTDLLIQSRSGAYMTDKGTNDNLKYIAMAIGATGLVVGAQGAATLAGESFGSSSPSGSILKTIGAGAGKLVNSVTSITGSLGDAIKPGLGKLTGAPLALMLGGLALHLCMNEYYLKMPQGTSVFNSFGWGGSKNFLVTDRTDANFLQPLGRQGLLDRINKDQLNGLGRAAPTSAFWDLAVA